MSAKRYIMRLIRSRSDTPKVFGVGLIKTGTSTLGHCMGELGYRHISHRRDMLALWSAQRIDSLLELADEYDSFEDLPWCLIYREAFEKYGDRAKFILTTRRDPQTWLSSLKKHSLTTDPVRSSRSVAFGYDYPHGYEAEHLAIYERHNAEVREFFSDKPGMLLEVCWESGDGWKELCGFLDCRSPSSNFPHKNQGTQKRTSKWVVAANEALIEKQLRLAAAE